MDNNDYSCNDDYDNNNRTSNSNNRRPRSPGNGRLPAAQAPYMARQARMSVQFVSAGPLIELSLLLCGLPSNRSRATMQGGCCSAERAPPEVGAPAAGTLRDQWADCDSR